MAAAFKQSPAPLPATQTVRTKRAIIPAPLTAHEARLTAALGLLLLSSSLGAFTAWQYLIPPDMRGLFFGLNPRAVTQFHQHLFPPFECHPSLASWSLGFRVLLLLVWAGYALVVVAGLRGGLPSARWTVAIVAAVSLACAILCPPLLTSDCYSYLGYAHLQVFHGLNPYITTTAPLEAHHDPVTRFLFWHQPTVYGPLWTGLEIGIVRLFPSSLWLQVVAMKVLECGALLGAAFAGGSLAEHLKTGRGRLTFLAIGLNPLLLIEGPGNGHNDLLMIALALGAAALLCRNQLGAASLLLGLSIGVKLISLALLPWMLVSVCRTKSEPGRWLSGLGLTVMALLPSVIGYIPFWHGASTFGGIQQRVAFCLSPTALAEQAHLSTWLLRHGAGTEVSRMLTALFQYRSLVLLYIGLSIWVGRVAKRETWLMAWAILGVFLMFFGTGMAFPWYVAWFWPFLMLRWDRVGLSAFGASFAVALVYECLYSCYVLA